MTRRILKILHLLGAAGMTGALAVHMILLATAPDTLSGYAEVRRAIELTSGWLLVLCLGITLVSGVFAIAAYSPFQNAGWVWAKAALGFPLFEGTLVTIDGMAQQAAAMSARAASGEIDPALVEQLVAREWNSLWIIMTLTIAQTVIGVWRPRRRRGGPAKKKSGSRGDVPA